MEKNAMFVTPKMRKRLVMGFVCATMLFVFVFVSSNEFVLRISPFLERFRDVDVSCYADPSTIHGVQNFYTGSLKKQTEGPIPGRGIFFHETSCFGDEGIVITPRQACAVESAAMMNPDMTVYLLILSPAKLSNVSRGLMKQLTSYKNVRIRRIFVDDYVKNTPLEDWYASGVLRASRWPRSHMSDILRYLTLWKFRGIYLDLDVVVTTSLEGLTNFAGAEDWEDVAAGVMGFADTDLGRTLADACLRDLKTNFRGDVWGNNGPGVITRTLQKRCATKYARDMTEARCRGFTVFPPSVFYPIHYKKWKEYFEIARTNDTMNAIKNARAIHVWNKLSSAEPVQVGSQVPYAVVAKKYCPAVYENCGKTF